MVLAPLPDVSAQSGPAGNGGAVWTDRGPARDAVRPREPARSPSPLSPSGTSQSDEDGARNMLLDALADLAEGRRHPGQRLLELVTARYPDAAAAAEARKHLAKLYADMDVAKPASGVTSAAHGGAAAPAAPDRSPAADAGWRVDIRRNTAAEDDFRIKAGDRIFFSAGSAELGGRARGVLQAQAAWLNRYTVLDVVVEGHADDPGTPEANRALARARAEAVRERLIAEGVDATRVGILVRGNSDRIATCPDTACAAQNRRAVSSLIETERAAAGRKERKDTGAERASSGIGLPR